MICFCSDERVRPAMAAAASIISGVILGRTAESGADFEAFGACAREEVVARARRAPGKREWPRPAAEQMARKRRRAGEEGRSCSLIPALLHCCKCTGWRDVYRVQLSSVQREA